MADEIRLRAPSVEQKIDVKVNGLDNITKLCKGLDSVSKSLKSLSEINLDRIVNSKFTDSMQNIARLADAVKDLREAGASLNGASVRRLSVNVPATDAGTEVTPKIDKAGFTEAKAVIKDYYDFLKKISNNKDIRIENGSYNSGSNQYRELAEEMNKAKAAYDSLQESMGSFGEKQRISLETYDAKRLRDYNLALEGSNAKFVKGSAEEARAYEELAKKADQARKAVRNFSAAQGSIKDGTSDAYKEIKKCEKSYDDLRKSLAKGELTQQGFKEKLTAINSRLTDNTRVIKENGDAHQAMGDKTKTAIAKFSQWLSVSTIVMAVVRSVKKMVTAVIELDTAMTELRKVTDETELRYNQFLDNASERAKKTGASLADTVTATADFARLGYSLEDAEKLSDAAVIYKNVGDGITNIQEASESIISTMKAFGVEAEDAMLIVDKFNEVGRFCRSYIVIYG